MDEVSNRTIVALLAVALVVSVAGTLFSVSELSELGGTYNQLSNELTGAAGSEGWNTSTGTSSVEISAVVSLALTDGVVDWGAGYVHPSHPRGIAFLDSNKTINIPAESAWVNDSTGWLENAIPGVALNKSSNMWMVIENNGSTALTLNISADRSADTWLCGNNINCNNKNAKLEVKAMNNETNACANQLKTLYEGPHLAMNSGGGNNVTLCKQFDSNDGSDQLLIWFNASVPKEAQSGAHSITLTFVGMDASLYPMS